MTAPVPSRRGQLVVQADVEPGPAIEEFHLEGIKATVGQLGIGGVSFRAKTLKDAADGLAYLHRRLLEAGIIPDPAVQFAQQQALVSQHLDSHTLGKSKVKGEN